MWFCFQLYNILGVLLFSCLLYGIPFTMFMLSFLSTLHFLLLTLCKAIIDVPCWLIWYIRSYCTSMWSQLPCQTHWVSNHNKGFVSINHDIFSQSNSAAPYFNASVNVSVDSHSSETLNSAQRFHTTGPETTLTLWGRTALIKKRKKAETD